MGDAFEYLLSVLGSQGDAGQFRTPRHIIDFMVDIVEPKKNETILDPACGTAGFLISSYKYILKTNSSGEKHNGDLLTPDERKHISENISGYDISPDMVRLSLVNMYLHRITEPKIVEYDTLTSDTKWNEYFDVILANPPFMSPKGGIKPHSRFSVQSKRSEALFVDYIAEHLTTTGRGAVIVPEGVIFKSDSAFTKLRKMLVDENYLYGVISLPSGIFNPYSGVKTSILLFDKVISKLTDKILFAKVENDGFALGAQRRPIEGCQLEAISSAIKEFRIKLYRGEAFESNLCTLVDKSKIAESGDYNLSGERYIVDNTSENTIRTVLIKDIIVTISPTEKIQSKDYQSTGKYPIIDQSQDFICGYTDNKALLTNTDRSSLVIFGDHTCAIKYVDFPFAQGADGIKILKTNDLVEPRFLYYYLTACPLPSDGYRRHFALLKEYKIPLPSLKKQRAIVDEIEGYQRIIDAARNIVDNYRPQIVINSEWPIADLKDITTFSQGIQVDLPLQSREYVEGYDRFIRIENYTQKSKDFRYIPKKLSKGKYIEEDDVIIVRYGATAGYIGRGFSGVIANNLFKVEPKIELLSKTYLYYALSSNDVQYELKKITEGGAMPALSFKAVEKISIPLPDLETQQQIVVEIEREQTAVDSAKELIEIFTAKINNRIAQIWNE